MQHTLFSSPHPLQSPAPGYARPRHYQAPQKSPGHEKVRAYGASPPYVFATVMSSKCRCDGTTKTSSTGMGNPDLPTPPHIVEKLIEAAQKRSTPLKRSRGIIVCAAPSPVGTSVASMSTLTPKTEPRSPGRQEGCHLALVMLSRAMSSSQPTFVPHPSYSASSPEDVRRIRSVAIVIFRGSAVASRQPGPPKLLIYLLSHIPQPRP
jgi:alanine-synthesizing transaminase